MNITNILIAAVLAYLVFLVLGLFLPYPIPMVAAILIFLSGLYGGNRFGRF